MKNKLTELGAPELPEGYFYVVFKHYDLRNVWVSVELYQRDHKIKILSSGSNLIDREKVVLFHQMTEQDVVNMCDNLYRRNFPSKTENITHLLGTHE